MNLLLYAVDMGCAIGGFVFGFGMRVQNWWAVLGFLILSRWIFHVVRGVFDLPKKEAP